MTDKNERIETLKAYMEANGISMDELATMQSNQSEVTEDPVLRPSEIAGVSNETNKDTATLTAELAALKAVVDNLSIGLSQLHEKINK